MSLQCLCEAFDRTSKLQQLAMRSRCFGCCQDKCLLRGLGFGSQKGYTGPSRGNIYVYMDYIGAIWVMSGPLGVIWVAQGAYMGQYGLHKD